MLASWKNLPLPREDPKKPACLFWYWGKVKYILSLQSPLKGEEGDTTLVESRRTQQLFQDQPCALLLGLTPWPRTSSAGPQPLLKPPGRRYKESRAAQTSLTGSRTNMPSLLCPSFPTLMFHTQCPPPFLSPFPALRRKILSSGVLAPVISM